MKELSMQTIVEYRVPKYSVAFTVFRLVLVATISFVLAVQYVRTTIEVEVHGQHAYVSVLGQTYLYEGGK
jgi:hypothetical protein